MNTVGPHPSGSTDQVQAQKKVRLEGVIIYLDSLHQPRSNSPDHRKQIHKVDRIRLAHKVGLEDAFHKLLVEVQAEEWM